MTVAPCPPPTIDRAVKGDRAAFAEIYTANAGLIVWLALRILGDLQSAEDVAQETFARALAKIGTYDQRGVPISAWLCKIARNAALDEIRARRRIADVGGIPTGYRWRDRDYESANARLDLYFATRRAPRRMPADWRHVVRQKFSDGASIAEIAAEMGRSEGAVKALYNRFLTSFRENAA